MELNPSTGSGQAGRIAQINASTQYFLDDALGSVRQMADASGMVRSSAHLSPDTSYGFTGEFTESTGMVYLRARHYRPQHGQVYVKGYVGRR